MAEAERRRHFMQLGMIGLGRMGSNMVERLLAGGHDCVVFDRSQDSVAASVQKGARGSRSLQDLIGHLQTPRVVWIMVPAHVVDGVIDELSPLLSPGDVVIDGGNTHYIDDIRRSRALSVHGIKYVDAGVSGGIWGRERGYCLMIGGERDTVGQLQPIFKTLAPGRDPAITQDPTVSGTATEGYLHCGAAGAGHFVKMVHNAIEYGLMAAYAEGFNLLAHAGAGDGSAAHDTTPLRHPDHFQYDFAVDEIAELWRHGSVIGSWLLDLTARALAGDPALAQFEGRVSDSGEGRWAAQAAIDTATPAPVLTAALFQRFSSRGESDFGDRLLSAMRHQFGGHREAPARQSGE
jgi:6-phosphogluconate dehydrogenase